jgi:NTE family protein
MDRAASFEGVAVPVEALAGAPLFDGLGAADLVAVAAEMRYRAYRAGEIICREGEPGESMFVILDGLVQVRVFELPAGGEDRALSFFASDRLVGKLRRGDVIGAMSLITGEPRNATAVASAPSAVLELREDAFRPLLARFPRLLENLVRILGRRLGQAASRHAADTHRGEAVALLAGRSLAHAVPEIVAAATASSVRGVVEVGVDGSASDALARLDGLLHDYGTVVVTAGLERPEVPLLLEHVDRAVVLAGEEEEALVAGLPDPPRDVVVAGELAPAQIAKLGRLVARTRLGLALGAGGAKGYAHIGTLYELEAAGYTVDCVGGSSIGAIVGACVAMGLDAAGAEAALRGTFTDEVVAETFRMSLGGGSGQETMVRILQEATGGRSFEDLLIPLVVMTVDLDARAPAPLRNGPVWEALVAATSLAGLYPPYELDGARLVDGLALVPVPTAAVEEAGADLTVSVNLMAHETLAAWPGKEPPPPEPERRRYRMLDTLLEVMDLAQLDTSVRNAALADVVVTPRFGPGSWREFQLADLFLAAGREAAAQALPALRALAHPT